MYFVIPFFMPHFGCPHQCLFCEQKNITGESEERGDEINEVCAAIEKWLPRRKKKLQTHFSFYGGSFTCLPLETQEKYLQAVQPWLEEGQIDCIRLSTRPDCVTDDICSLLSSHHVGIVELGVQSLDEAVLKASLRGHSAYDCLAAAELLKKYGITCGIQLMPGLPKESRNSFMRTVLQVVEMKPAMVRLYPTVIIKGSGLERLYNAGEYSPLSLSKAVVLTNWARTKCMDNGIDVIRMGLQPTPSLEKSIVTGPYHPAFGEMVLSRYWYIKVKRCLARNPGKRIEFYISSRDLSAFLGRKKENIRRFEELGLSQRFEVNVEPEASRGSFHYVVC